MIDKRADNSATVYDCVLNHTVYELTYLTL